MFSFEKCNIIFDTWRKTKLIMKEPILKLSSLTDIIFIFGHKEATNCIEIRWFERLLLKKFSNWDLYLQIGISELGTSK